MNYLYTYRAFFGSISIGILVWIVSYIMTPVEPVEVVRPKTIYFIVSCYLSLILGFGVLKFKSNQKIKKIDPNYRLKLLLIFIIVCFVIRWVELFYFREVSFYNTMVENRVISYLNNNSNIIFIIASLFKSLYFLPITFVIKNKNTSKLFAIIAFTLLLFPLIESTIYGNRKPFFESFFMLLIASFLYKTPKINVKNVLILVFSIFILLTISYSILLKREGEKKNVHDVYSHIVEARYNDLLKPKDKIVEFIKDPKIPEIKKNYYLIALQTGQYISHGFFEFNHIMENQDLALAKGGYTFYPFLKFLRKLRLVDGYDNLNVSPRNHTYLTAFGGLYIDFRWAAVILFFLFGLFQRYVYDSSSSSIIHSALLVYVIIINIFLPIMNYIRGAGIYPIVGLILLIFINLSINKAYEKSSSA
ncbi:hypothetical protein [Winogradskyella flava]|uniref:hypothetical protein n=1 Tax=Winogradskyella flava TaxID=1884876 RepID=UPI00248FA61F|nr:hypothetical protein [Winogradskyella flava]